MKDIESCFDNKRCTHLPHHKRPLSHSVVTDVLHERLGSGHSGTVYRATTDEQGACVALKIFDCVHRGKEELEQELHAYAKVATAKCPSVR